MSAYSTRASVLVGWTLLMLAGCDRDLPTRFASLEKVSQGEVDSLWSVCKAADEGGELQKATRPRSDLHDGLELWVHKGASKRDFIDLYTKGALVGAIKNDGPFDSPVDRNWTVAPKGLSCVFMGGDREGLYARVVSFHYDSAVVQVREVTARFHTRPHMIDDAEWDRPIDQYDSQPSGSGPSEEGMHLGVLPEGANPLLDTGTGPWYTCASNTCCKAN